MWNHHPEITHYFNSRHQRVLAHQQRSAAPRRRCQLRTFGTVRNDVVMEIHDSFCNVLNTFSFEFNHWMYIAKNMTNSQQAINLVELAQQKCSVWEDGDEVSTKTTVSPLKMKHLTTVSGKIGLQKNAKHHLHSHFIGSTYVIHIYIYISCFQSQKIYITAFSNLQKNQSFLLLGGGSARILL